ncbi:MAG: DoxX family protein [Nanoarchaeota archaeon]
MNSRELGNIILRVSLALVFIYFGFQQVRDPSSWSTFVPDFLKVSGISGNNVVLLNGVLELVLGTFLIIGLYVRFSALILAIHLFGIAFSIGFTPLGVRDFGLAFATLALYFYGYDKYTLDYRFEKKIVS